MEYEDKDKKKVRELKSKFCEECGTFLREKKEFGNKIYLYCSRCDILYSLSENQLAEEPKIPNKPYENIIIMDKEIPRPVTKISCPKCGNDEAFYKEYPPAYGDEAALIIYKCKKCGHSWRTQGDYGL